MDPKISVLLHHIKKKRPFHLQLLDVVYSNDQKGAAEPHVLSELRNIYYMHENKNSRLVSACKVKV